MNFLSAVTSDMLGRLHGWYDSYAQSYKNGDARLEDAVQMKYEHTKRVCIEMEDLCGSISLDGPRRALALTAALLHDVSRFEQFKQYRTFSDARSKDHAVMGVELIEKLHLLDGYDPVEAEVIKKAVRFHNAVEVPLGLTEEQRLFCRLLRDVDKLDIYKITLEYYVNPDQDRKETVQIGIADGRSVSPEICDSVRDGKFVLYEKVRTVTDFKLIQAGWVYDLNFPHSFRCVHQRGYLNKLRKALPETPEVVQALNRVERFLMAHLE